jgi:phage minor structural protein
MHVIDVLSNNGDSPKSPFFDDSYVQDMATGAETFEFTTLSNERTSKYIIAGGYVAFKYKNKTKLFQILETTEEHEEGLYKSCYCEVAGLELINEIVRPREIAAANIKQFMETILADTDWKLGIVDAGITNVLTTNIDKSMNVYKLIQDNLSVYGIEIEYRAVMSHNQVIGKYIDVYSQRGKETKKRFEYGVNVSGVSKQVDMSEFCTALVGIGANGIDFKSVAGTGPIVKPINQDFVADEEAYKTWNKNGSHITGTFEFNTESPAELLRLTWNELQRRKQPKFTYDIKTEMILGDEEGINIGDTVYVIDNDYAPALHLSARVGKLEISLTDHTKNKCILTNFKDVKSGVLSLETIQAIISGKFPVTSDNIADGAITEGKIDTQYLTTIKTDVLIAAKVEAENLVADKATIGELNAANAKINNLVAKDAQIDRAIIDNLTATNAEITNLKAKDASIENLVATKANITDLNVTNANITNLTATKANVTDLTAANADITNLKADVANIDTLLAGNITAANIKAGTITAGSGIIANGAIGSAQISSLDAAKVNAGTIDTSKVTVAGPNSNLKMSGNRLQVFTGIGSGQVERVSLGDVNGNGSKYGLLIRGADGQTVIMDENGVTNAGITNGSITNEKISGTANIDGAKLNISSVVTKINAGTTSISGAKIDVNGTSLTTKLSTIDTTQTAQGQTITEHSSKIAANETAINLKVDSQTYQTDKTAMTTTLNKNTSDINLLNNEIALKVEQTDINTAKSELLGTMDTKINAAKSEIKVTTDAITQRVSSTETTVNTVTNTANTALTNANNANTLADSKAKVFTATPTVPYKVGDLWTQGTTGDVMKCKVARATGSYTASDWEKASKYTDDTTANTAKTTADSALSKANTNTTSIASTNSKVSTIETNLTSITSRVGTVESKQTTTDGKVTSLETRMTGAESKITDTAITNTVKANFYTKSETDTAITSKGYQTSSQVQQTVNALEIKFEESGGYNLLYNGDFKREFEKWNLNGTVDYATTCTCPNSIAVNILGALNTTKWITQNVNLDKNASNYTLSCWMYTSSTGADGTTNPFRKLYSNLVYTDGTASYPAVQNTKYDTWEKVSITFTKASGKQFNRLEVFGYVRDTTKRVYFSQIQVEKGSVATEWSPNPNEIYDGITTIDKDGITVKNNNSDTYTQIDSGSFRVENNTGGTIAEFSTTSNIPILKSGTITADAIYAPNIVNTQQSLTYYVNLSTGNDNNNGSSTSPLKTIQAALDNLYKFLEDDTTITIIISGTGSQEVRMRGFQGAGQIHLSFANGSKLYTSLFDIRECTCKVKIAGADTWSNSVGQIINGDTGSCIYVRTCSFVEIYHMCICGSGKGNGYAVTSVSGSTVYVNACEIDRFSSPIRAEYKGRISLFNTSGSDLDYLCTGSNFGEIYLQEGYGVVPNATYESNSTGASYYMIFGGDQGQTSGTINTRMNGAIYPPSYVPPAPPATTTNTRTWTFNKIWSDETLNGWSDKSELIQGYCSSWSTGRWTGYMQMTDDFAAIRTAIAGGTNLSGRIYIQRRTTSGNSVDSKLCLYGSDGTAITTSTLIDQGQGVWVALSAAIVAKIQSGAIKYFYLKADTNSAATYFKCESNAKIELTYTS